MKQLLENLNKAEQDIFNYFGIEEYYRKNRFIVDSTDIYWSIEGESLIYADTKEDIIEDGNYYSLDRDDVDEMICGEYNNGGITAILVGCGEHKTPELWVLDNSKKS